MKLYLTLFLICFSLISFGQFNMTLQSRLDYQVLREVGVNDVWGYVDEVGNEYALIGTTHGTSVVDISDPTDPIEVFWEPGMESTWRDLKTYGDYAYITTEAENGLLIIDLSPLPHSTVLPVAYYNGDNGVDFKRAHNLYIENGKCFLFGSNIGNGGVQILDLTADPMNPTWIGEFDNWYCHDGVVKGNNMYLAHIYEGFMSIVDISDIDNPVVLGTKTTTSNFTHNIWPSDDGNYVYTTDEVANAFLEAYDVSDPSNIIELDIIQSSPGHNIIPHNTHFINDYIVTSYYTDGVTIHDVSIPYNMIEVGNYDTHPEQNNSFNGCWGAYPYLPSGLILASDRQFGLHVLSPNYQRAAYLEGTITDINTSIPLDNVKVTISNFTQLNHSNEDGFYATGRADGGAITVTYSKVGYFDVVENVTIQNGIVTTLDVEMTPIPPYDLKVIVLENGTNNPINNAHVRIENEFIIHDGITNAIGEEDLILFYENNNSVTVGKWGYITKCMDMQLDENTIEITVHLEPGYYDDFSFDFGWLTAGSALLGRWVRDIPFGTTEMANPGYDVVWDCGEYAFVTGNANVFDFTTDEVDDGDVQLYSPTMDLSTYTDPYINYYKWFYTRYGIEPVSDSLTITIMNGSESVIIDVLKKRNVMHEWIPTSIRLADHITITNNMTLHVMTSDFHPDWNVVEAGIDYFRITEGSTIEVETVTNNNTLRIYPNPVNDFLKIDGIKTPTTYSIIDLNGREMQSGMLENTSVEIQLSNLQAGVYLVKVGTNIQRIIKN